MNNDHIISTLNKELDDLEVKIEELSNKYLDLKKENQLLKVRNLENKILGVVQGSFG